MNVLIIGGGLLGRETAQQLDRLGGLDELWLIARREERLKALGQKLSTPSRVLPLDLTDPTAVPVLQTLLEEERPVLDTLVCAAGFGKFGRAEDLTGAETASMIDLNCCSAAEVTRVCIPYLKRDSRVLEALAARGRTFALRHCANSGALARYPEMYLDMVRPGIALYGSGDDAERLGLRPVMALKSCVSTIKVFDPETDVSYGRTFRTVEKTRVGVLPIGYGDGLFRGLSNRMAVRTAQGCRLTVYYARIYVRVPRGIMAEMSLPALRTWRRLWRFC